MRCFSSSRSSKVRSPKLLAAAEPPGCPRRDWRSSGATGPPGSARTPDNGTAASRARRSTRAARRSSWPGWASSNCRVVSPPSANRPQPRWLGAQADRDRSVLAKGRRAEQLGESFDVPVGIGLVELLEHQMMVIFVEEDDVGLHAARGFFRRASRREGDRAGVAANVETGEKVVLPPCSFCTSSISLEDIDAQPIAVADRGIGLAERRAARPGRSARAFPHKRASCSGFCCE